MDRFDYVMYGKVFKYKDTSAGGQLRVEVYVSFGGLLMQLTGDPKKLKVIELDKHVYLLMRKV
jgi:DNA-directed RNA polymerase I, II, and III subunit RPABC3